ncbi:MAG TPA: dipicolinate synthase subunit DpsA [Steroidobacteraceae bacterium]|nr:dipicolinate synthase subunit DpsA [Steroidobacteraceae bacterium]
MEQHARTHSPAWHRLAIAIVGGDEREQEIARLAASSGAAVRAFGFPWPPDGIPGVVRAGSAREALYGARVALFPIPGIATDGSLFGTEKIIPTEDLLAVMAAGAHIILGRTDGALRHAAAARGIAIHEYEHDQELMLLRAPAIAEAAVKIIIENTSITIHGAEICVVGLGNIGAVLVRTLIALGARVTAAARNPVQRAAAHTMGARGLPLDQLEHAAGTFDVIVSTVPAPVVTAAIIDRLPARGLIMDLAAPPGSCDLAHATRTGRKAIWARALGRRAPVTVGASQWRGIAKIIDTILDGEAPG